MGQNMSQGMHFHMPRPAVAPDEHVLLQGFRLFPGLFLGLAFFATSLLASVLATSIANAETAASSKTLEAVALMYHRFGEKDFPSTNTTIEQFEAHIEELKTGDYTVLPLREIVAALRENRALPTGAIAITVDDAYRSVYTEAWPRLKKAGLPFTLFVSTEAVDRATNGTYTLYMNWDQLREMQANGVDIGNHTQTHPHMTKADSARNDREIKEASNRFRTELGMVPDFFAYPYGETSADVIDLAKTAGFSAAFGQHSGAIGPSDDLFNLPRFALNEDYGDIERFRLVTKTRHLPVADVEPRNMLINAANNPPPIGFTVTGDVGSLGGLACYIAGEGKVAIENLGDVRVEIRATQPFAEGRTRLNCTMAAEDGRWYWFSRQFYRP